MNCFFRRARNVASLPLLAVALVVSSLSFTACNEKESDLGVELQDPSSLYNGIADTAYAVACTVVDDSLITSGQVNGIVGCYQDDFFGYSEAILYSRVATANNDGIEFDQYCHIDSVVLSLSVTNFYDSPASPSSSKGYRDLHFEVYQLEQGIEDTTYYSFNELPVGATCFYNGVVRLAEADTMVASMHLSNAFAALIDNHTYASADDFYNVLKGIRIRLVNDGTPVMAALNLGASSTRITTYYYYYNGGDTIYRTYEFVVGHDTPHFMQFKNSYKGDLACFNNGSADTLDGSRYLYLTPMGGTNLRLNFGQFVAQFHQDHPYATVHYAELLLPVADIATDEKPDLIAAFHYLADSSLVSVADLYDKYTGNGYDGTYDDDHLYYRIRITQHWQKLLRAGVDYGTLLVVNSRRSSPLRTVLNGSDSVATGGNPLRIHFVYSE